MANAKNASALVFLALALGGCGLLGSDGGLDEDYPRVTVEQQTYALGDTATVTIENFTSETVWLDTGSPPYGYVLQKREGAEWRVAVSRSTLLCSVETPVRSGGKLTARISLHVRENEPYFANVEAGTYRVVMLLSRHQDCQGRLPDEVRATEPFELTE